MYKPRSKNVKSVRLFEVSSSTSPAPANAIITNGDTTEAVKIDFITGAIVDYHQAYVNNSIVTPVGNTFEGVITQTGTSIQNTLSNITPVTNSLWNLQNATVVLPSGSAPTSGKVTNLYSNNNVAEAVTQSQEAATSATGKIITVQFTTTSSWIMSFEIFGNTSSDAMHASQSVFSVTQTAIPGPIYTTNNVTLPMPSVAITGTSPTFNVTLNTSSASSITWFIICKLSCFNSESVAMTFV
jgi:hypothetical protein